LVYGHLLNLILLARIRAAVGARVSTAVNARVFADISGAPIGLDTGIARVLFDRVGLGFRASFVS
jgi:hypothetical protein